MSRYSAKPPLVLRVSLPLAMLACQVGLVACNNALANGDIFFHQDVFDLSDKPLEEQVVFAGNVKDTHGKYIVDATITISVPVLTDRGERILTYNAYTDVLGRYRTLDVGSVILALEEAEYEFDPRKVELTVEKQGYKMVQRFDRSRRSQTGGIFGLDFVMAESDSVVE